MNAPADVPVHLEAWPVEGIGEVVEGADLAALLDGTDLHDGDVVVVTSKVVAKAEGRVRRVDRDAAIDEESVRVVARRGRTRIVEHRLGLVMAAAGVDASNVDPGHVVLLPVDPDASARRLREALRARQGVDVAVVVTDTVGRAWRAGQTDLAIGVAGLSPTTAVAETDAYGNPLVVTAPAAVDEVAGLAELVTGKTGGRPVSIVRGLGSLVLPPDEHGPGAQSLVRPRSADMFALGAREAVVAALAGSDTDCFGEAAPLEEVLEHLASAGHDGATSPAGHVLVTTTDPVTIERVRLLAQALAWTTAPAPTGLLLSPRP